MFDSNDFNRYVMTVLFLSQALLSVLLTIAIFKNHFIRKNIRPAVLGLALYVGFGALQTFFRLIARMLIEHGGDANSFVQGVPWTVANTLYTISAVGLTILLMRAYPSTHTIDLDDRLKGHFRGEGDDR